MALGRSLLVPFTSCCAVSQGQTLCLLSYIPSIAMTYSFCKHILCMCPSLLLTFWFIAKRYVRHCTDTHLMAPNSSPVGNLCVSLRTSMTEECGLVALWLPCASRASPHHVSLRPVPVCISLPPPPPPHRASQVMHPATVLQGDALEDMTGDHVSEEQFTDEHGNIVTKKVSGGCNGGPGWLWLQQQSLT